MSSQSPNTDEVDFQFEPLELFVPAVPWAVIGFTLSVLYPGNIAPAFMVISLPIFVGAYLALRKRAGHAKVAKGENVVQGPWK